MSSGLHNVCFKTSVRLPKCQAPDSGRESVAGSPSVRGEADVNTFLQPSLLDLSPAFDGPCYDPALDQARLTKQIGRVYAALCLAGWWTLSELHAYTGDPEASISAHLRHLRKPRFGSHQIDKRRRAEGGTWEYRLVA